MITREGDVPPLQDPWNYAKGTGGGRSNVWEQNRSPLGSKSLIERGGVLFSGIGGASLPPSALAVHSLPPGTSFQTCGVSLVLHPVNPHIPTIHMNVRYMETSTGKWWFGGGIDVTPYYPVFAQIVDFHKRLEILCHEFNFPYQEFKEYCDKYFVNHHRLEMRGVGGIFFENLTEEFAPKKKIFAFCVRLGKLMADYYSHVIRENRDTPTNEEERDFQLIRRARYAEFNLIHDRGTKFGLQSKGRIESIFCSLPAECRWRYQFQPSPGSREELVMSKYLKPQNWVEVTCEEELQENPVPEAQDPTKL